MFAPKRILVPTDFSKYADAALRKASDIAVQFQSKVFLLHVIDHHFRQFGPDYRLDDSVMAQIDAESVKQTEMRLQKEVDTVTEAKQIEITFDIQKGHPAEVIIQEQRAKEIDLIVIGSLGRSGVLKHLIGSVADKVVSGADCSVLVVKA